MKTIAPKMNPTLLQALGNTLEIKVSSAESGGAFSVVDFQIAAGFAAPPFFHANTREDWWGQVLEGEVAIEAKGGPVQKVGPGGWVFVPRGTPFRWWNPEPKPARWLLTYSPGGFDQYFVEVAAKKPASPQEMAAIVGPLWDKYGVTR